MSYTTAVFTPSNTFNPWNWYDKNGNQVYHPGSNKNDTRLYQVSGTYYVSKSTLKTRGWTDGDIQKKLGRAVMALPNPHHPAGRHMGVYDWQKVQQIENSK